MIISLYVPATEVFEDGRSVLLGRIEIIIETLIDRTCNQ